MPDPFDQFADAPAQQQDEFAQFNDAPAATRSLEAHLPGGKVVKFDAPVDADDDHIRQLAAKATGTQHIVVKHGEPAPDTRPTSFWQGLKEGVEQPLNRASEWVEGGLDKAGGLFGDPTLGQDINSIGSHVGLAGSVAQAEQTQQQANDAAATRGSGLGRFVGGAAATAALPGGVLAQGALGGALTSQGKGWQDQLLGAGLGAAGGAIGGAVLKGAAKLAAPVVSPALRTLIDAGVNITPGQYARSLNSRVGNLIATAEERATSTPITGIAVAEGRARSIDDFGRATLNRALGPIGEKLPDNVTSGRDAVKYAGDKLSAEYDRLLPSITATGDNQFAQDLSQIHQEASTLAPDRITQFNSVLKDLGRYWQNGQQLNGDAFKAIETRLGQRVRKFISSPDADQSELGQRLQDVLEATRSLAERQNPAIAKELSDVNRGWASLAQVERAAGNSRGDITPAGYSQAVKLSSSTVRRRGYARGEALNQDLSDAASDILPSRTGDSGTAGRVKSDSLTANLIGAAQLPGYLAARAAVPLLTRQNAVSPGISSLLQLGARAAPIVSGPAATGLIGQPRR